jgi:putative transposase
MSQARSVSAGKIYGLQRVCRVWHVPRSTIYEHQTIVRTKHVSVRRGPKGPCPDEELVEQIRM